MFETYLGGRKQSWAGRATTLAVSVALHMGGVGLILFLSLFHVEELPEPQVTVKFFTMAPPPPPPPPPPAARKKPKRKPTLSRPKPKPQDIQPPEKPPPPKKEEPEPEPEPAGGEEEGVEGGVEGGVPGGVVSKRPPPKPKEPTRPVFVPPQVAEKLKISGEMPRYLPMARMARVEGKIIIKVCIRTDGTVSSIKILKGLPALNNEVISKVKTWRYKPHMVDGKPIATCSVVRFVFRYR